MTGVVEHVVGGRRSEEIMRDTWGHLDAESGVEYPGTILFAEGAFGGQLVILRSDFGDAGYGPWFYEGVHDWLCEQQTDPGQVYEFRGTYTLTLHGEHQFVGDIIAVALRETHQGRGG